VYAWTRRRERPDTGEPYWILIVNNGTEYPIFRWKATLSWAEPGGTVRIDTVSDEDVGLLAPGEQRYEWAAPGQPPGVDARVEVDLLFKDRFGGSQNRAPSGELKAVKSLVW
jgi:hypothetical protein